MDIVFLKLQLFGRRKVAEERLRVTLRDAALILGRRVPDEHGLGLNSTQGRQLTTHYSLSGVSRMQPSGSLWARG